MSNKKKDNEFKVCLERKRLKNLKVEKGKQMPLKTMEKEKKRERACYLNPEDST